MFSLLESFYRILVKNLPITFLKNPKSQLLYTYFKLTKPRIIKNTVIKIAVISAVIGIILFAVSSRSLSKKIEK